MAKKTHIGVNEKNELIKELKDSEFIKNPFLYSQIRGDFSLMQTNIMISILSALQDEINDFLAKQKITDGPQLSLFNDSFFKDGEKEFVIDLHDIDVRPDAYNELEEACHQLLRMDMSYQKYDIDSGYESVAMANIFTRIEIPKSHTKKDSTEFKFKSRRRREGSIKVFMSKGNMEDIFDMRKGYVEHIRRIVPLCRRKRTPRLYIYLSKWKDVGHKLVNYQDLKEYLGVLRWDANRTSIKEDSYEKFSLFCKFVLDPIKKEMDSLSESNQIEFSFEYEPRYKGSRKRGNPDELLFNITLSKMGKDRKTRSYANKDQSDYQKILKNEYGLTDNDIQRIYSTLTNEMIPDFNKEVMRMKERVDKYKPRSVKAYVIQSLRNFIESIRPVAEELIIEEEEKCKKQNEEIELSIEDKHSWELFLQLAKGAIGENEFNVWISCLELYSFKNGVATVVAPNKFVVEKVESMIEILRESFYAAFGEGSELEYVISNT